MQRCMVVGLLLILNVWSMAADWPRWRGPQGNGHVPQGVAVPKALPDEPKVLWKMEIGFGLASPVVSGSKVFYLDNQENKETLHVVDAAMGKELWKATLDDSFKDGQSAAGPRCTPLVDGERVYIQSCRGEFQCLNVADGKVLWRVNFVKDFGAVFTGERGSSIGASRHGYSGSPVIDGDHIIVGVGGPDGASVVCFNKLNGQVIWQSQNDVAGYSGPVLATIANLKQVISFTAKAVIGLDATDGKLLWRFPIDTSFGRHAMTPVVVDNMVMVASHQAGLMGLRISRQGNDFTAEKAWGTKEQAVNFSSPVAAGNYLYGLGPSKMMFCIDVRNGEKAWVKERFFGSMIKKDYASFIGMQDNLLVLTDSGQLLLMAADPKECRIVSQVQVSGENWCNPAYSDGKLFVRDDEELRCVQLLP